ncbi:transferase activity protein [[Candida] boidinii]|nr:transferase activity protein [[Candida] boidinii]OWB84105.1 transferase activity protein [[Candida] boidinii]
MTTTTIDLTNDINNLKTKYQKRRLPRVLTIAGSDPSGGAGIEADLKTITVHGCYDKIATSAKGTEDILISNLDDITVNSVKTGMLSREVIEILPKILDKYCQNIPIVMDPIIGSSSGYSLTKLETVRMCIKDIYPRATLLTPNYIESLSIIELSKGKEFADKINPKTVDDLIEVAKLLQEIVGCQAVLLKGGHFPWDENFEATSVSGKPVFKLTDVLYDSETGQVTVFSKPWVSSSNTHGTGCTLSSAIASNLALGDKLPTAVGKAVKFVHLAIEFADESIGAGNGPLNHVYEIYEI